MTQERYGFYQPDPEPDYGSPTAIDWSLIALIIAALFALSGGLIWVLYELCMWAAS